MHYVSFESKDKFKSITRPRDRTRIQFCSVRITEVRILQIGLVLERVEVEVLLGLVVARVPASVSSNQCQAHHQDICNEDGVKSQMDVEAVVVSWSPDRLEELRSDRVPRGPCNN